MRILSNFDSGFKKWHVLCHTYYNQKCQKSIKKTSEDWPDLTMKCLLFFNARYVTIWNRFVLMGTTGMASVVCVINFGYISGRIRPLCVGLERSIHLGRPCGLIPPPPHLTASTWHDWQAIARCEDTYWVPSLRQHINTAALWRRSCTRLFSARPSLPVEPIWLPATVLETSPAMSEFLWYSHFSTLAPAYKL